jgi:hypothetical protein
MDQKLMLELSSKLYISLLDNLAVDLLGPFDFAADEQPFSDILYCSERIKMVDSLK